MGYNSQLKGSESSNGYFFQKEVIYLIKRFTDLEMFLKQGLHQNLFGQNVFLLVSPDLGSQLWIMGRWQK